LQESAVLYAWKADYVRTYLERDVRQALAIPDLARFQIFISMLALRAAQVLNLSEVARDTGIPESTSRKWLSVLQATYTIRLIQPYFQNPGKRLIKSPKVIFLDSGLLCYLLGIGTADEWKRSPLSGYLFENMVIADAIKTASTLLRPPEFFYVRNHEQREIDLLIKSTSGLHAFAIKAHHSPKPDDVKHLLALQASVGWTSASVLSQQQFDTPLRKDILAQHCWKALQSTLVDTEI